MGQRQRGKKRKDGGDGIWIGYKKSCPNAYLPFLYHHSGFICILLNIFKYFWIFLIFNLYFPSFVIFSILFILFGNIIQYDFISLNRFKSYFFSYLIIIILITLIYSLYNINNLFIKKVRALYLHDHYSKWAVVPPSQVMARPQSFSLHYINSSSPFLFFLFFLNAISALFLLVGYKTRLANFVCWVFMLSLHNRNPLVLNAGLSLILSSFILHSFILCFLLLLFFLKYYNRGWCNKIVFVLVHVLTNW